MKVVVIRGQVVTTNLQNLRYKPFSWPVLDLHNYIQRARNVALDRGIRHFNAALEHACGKSRYSLNCRIGMDGRDCAAVTCV
jgi:hypothetical protein